jgi:DNA-nicking Smr family endonuclease
LFREATRDVKRLDSKGDRRDAAATAAQIDRAPGSGFAQAPRARAEPRTAPRNRGAADIRKSGLKSLQRGRVRVDASLDLHGLTAEAARRRLQQVLDEARAERLRCVRIVHGKGLRSGPAGPVLKTLVHATLRSYDGIGAFTDAPPAGGGSGATIVLLSVSRGQRSR